MNLQRNQQTVPEGCEEDLLTLDYCCKENTTYLPSSNQTWLAGKAFILFDDFPSYQQHFVRGFSSLPCFMRLDTHEPSTGLPKQLTNGTQSVAKVLVVHYFLPGSI
jgi:hypothetical protein